mgnify:CR=1 FL=1|tara:strand:- start:17 stop:307 length:291 start_codon:yes stop_codon:yes gene_type:complete
MNIDKVVQLIREAKKKSKCPPGYKWSKKKRECVPKRSSKWKVYAGWGRGRDEREEDENKKNGSNGNGHSNGGSGNGDGGNGNGGNGNGGSNGGGGE